MNAAPDGDPRAMASSTRRMDDPYRSEPGPSKPSPTANSKRSTTDKPACSTRPPPDKRNATMPTPAEKYADSGAAADDADTWWNNLDPAAKVDIFAGTSDYNTALADWVRDEILDGLAERDRVFG